MASLEAGTALGGQAALVGSASVRRTRGAVCVAFAALAAAACGSGHARTAPPEAGLDGAGDAAADSFVVDSSAMDSSAMDSGTDGDASLDSPRDAISAGVVDCGAARRTLCNHWSLSAAPDLATGAILGAGEAGVSMSPFSVAIGDLNGDCKPDLAAAQQYGGVVGVFLGNGDGTFRDQVTYMSGTPRWVAMGDLNGDGKLDLAVANFSFGAPASVGVFLGQGDGTFGIQKTFPTGLGAMSVAIGDLNGDGRPDLVVANDYDLTLSVLLGRGDGTFDGQVTYPTDTGPDCVVLRDLNGDGKLDVAVGFIGSSTLGDVISEVSVYLGKGDGTLGPEVYWPAGIGSSALAVGDLNGDGKPDIAAIAMDSDVDVLLGNGDGTFKAATKWPVNQSPVSVAIGDMNGDGFLDLAVANNNQSGTVGVLLGHGDGTFAAQVVHATGAMSFFVAAGDLNGDGRDDLVVANSSGSTVSVLLSTCSP